MPSVYIGGGNYDVGLKYLDERARQRQLALQEAEAAQRMRENEIRLQMSIREQALRNAAIHTVGSSSRGGGTGRGRASDESAYVGPGLSMVGGQPRTEPAFNFSAEEMASRRAQAEQAQFERQQALGRSGERTLTREEQERKNREVEEDRDLNRQVRQEQIAASKEARAAALAQRQAEATAAQAAKEREAQARALRKQADDANKLRYTELDRLEEQARSARDKGIPEVLPQIEAAMRTLQAEIAAQERQQALAGPEDMTIGPRRDSPSEIIGQKMAERLAEAARLKAETAAQAKAARQDKIASDEARREEDRVVAERVRQTRWTKEEQTRLTHLITELRYKADPMTGQYLYPTVKEATAAANQLMLAARDAIGESGPSVPAPERQQVLAGEDTGDAWLREAEEALARRAVLEARRRGITDTKELRRLGEEAIRRLR